MRAGGQRLLFQQRLEGRHQRFGDDAGAFGGGVNAVGLNGAGHMNQVFVDHGHHGDVVFGGECGEEPVKGVDIVGAVIGRQGDAGQQNANVRFFERGQHQSQVAPGLRKGQAAETVVAAELDDDDGRMQAKHVGQVGDGVFGGRAWRAHVPDQVAITVGVQDALQGVGEGLAVRQPVAGGDAVAIADKQRPRRGGNEPHRQKQQQQD